MESEVRKKWAKHYVDALIAAGLATMAWSFFCLTDSTPRLSLLVLGLVTYVVSRHITISIPGTKGEVTIHDTFVLVGLFMHGVEAGTLLGAISGFGASAHCAKTKRTLVVNTVMMALSVFLAGRSTQWLVGEELTRLTENPGETGLFIFALGFLALIYFAVNTATISLALSIRTGQSIFEVWSDSFLWSSVTHFVGALAAGLTLEAITVIDYFGLIILVPVLLITYFSYRKFFDKVEASNQEVRDLADLHLSTIEALALAIDAKDRISRGHARRVQIAAIEIAAEMGIKDEALLEALKAASLLHDIGKLAVPDHILNKPGELTEAEFEKVKIHPEVSARILSSIDFPYPVVPIVRAHHEHWNGQGYPHGLSGEEIPLGARILVAADVYDGVRVNRNSEVRASLEEIIQAIGKRAGTVLDPRIAEACCRAAARIEEKMDQALIPDVKLEAAERGSGSDTGSMKKIVTADVYQDIADAQREVLALYELSQTLASTLDLQDLLSALASRIRKVMPCDTCVIFLADGGREKIQAALASGLYSEELTGKVINWGYGLSGWAAANNAPMINARAHLDFPFLGQGENPLMHAIAIPLIYHGRALGVLTLYAASHYYDPDEIRLIEAFAHHAATALHNVLTLEETREDAYTDELTGLPNVRYLNLLLEQQLAETAQGQPKELTLLLLDLDGFKAVNDNFGHEVGDEVLRRVSAVMRENLRSADTLARQGGDEFVVVLQSAAPHDVEQMIARLQDAVDNFVLPLDSGRSARVGVSIGSAIFPTDGTTFKELKEAADQRMYSNKKARRTSRLSNVIQFRTGTTGF
ncbi:MAG TPA: diguanylate cyclase [Blastocatellia bacterium]|nr:diguanylate cyclase [Blastocatellia bacterium]